MSLSFLYVVVCNYDGLLFSPTVAHQDKLTQNVVRDAHSVKQSYKATPFNNNRIWNTILRDKVVTYMNANFVSYLMCARRF